MVRVPRWAKLLSPALADAVARSRLVKADSELDAEAEKALDDQTLLYQYLILLI